MTKYRHLLLLLHCFSSILSKLFEFLLSCDADDDNEGSDVDCTSVSNDFVVAVVVVVDDDGKIRVENDKADKAHWVSALAEDAPLVPVREVLSALDVWLSLVTWLDVLCSLALFKKSKKITTRE